MNNSIGQIVASYGRFYTVRLECGEEVSCVSRGKKNEAACGDLVEIQYTSQRSETKEAQGVIEKIQPRRSLLYRSDAFKTKTIAANVTQIFIVLASEPRFSDELLTRCLIAAQHQDIKAQIILNKCDLPSSVLARKELQPYIDIGYSVLELSAKQNVAALHEQLIGYTSIFVGQSGMGKSTLINALYPEARAATREISTALDSGKHTTTHARLYQLNAESKLIDCPGVQAFGLYHLSLGEIEQGFVEFSDLLGTCRFHNCSHTHEPGCAIQQAVNEGKIDTRRMQLFQQISKQL